VFDFSITAEPNKRGVQAGTVRVERGGKLYSTANSTINCSNGVVTVSGAGSTWDMANTTLTIGGAGLGGNELVLADSGMLSNAKIVVTETQLVNRVSFDGGILKAGSAGTLISGSGACLIKTNGAIIDSAGFTVANAMAMTEDPTSTGGGFTKLGAGTLTLASRHPLYGRHNGLQWHAGRERKLPLRCGRCLCLFERSPETGLQRDRHHPETLHRRRLAGAEQELRQQPRQRLLR
jgi:T5SS/PEP-CTERM-associated repeat protein